MSWGAAPTLTTTSTRSTTSSSASAPTATSTSTQRQPSSSHLRALQYHMSCDHPKTNIGAQHSLYATPLHCCYTSPIYKHFHTIICNNCCFRLRSPASATTATCSSARLLGIPAPTASGIDHVLLASYANFTFIILHHHRRFKYKINYVNFKSTLLRGWGACCACRVTLRLVLSVYTHPLNVSSLNRLY